MQLILTSLDSEYANALTWLLQKSKTPRIGYGEGMAMTGSFNGVPCAVWVTAKPPEPDRLMCLTGDLVFIDPNGKPWAASGGLVTDGASIPRALWSLVGSPFTGNCRRAALFHDQACDAAGTDNVKRREADRVFYSACRAGGCSPREATILYIGVRIGALIGAVPAWGPRVVDVSPRLDLTPFEKQQQGDFQAIAGKVLADISVVESDDVFKIEASTDAAMEQVFESIVALG